MNPLQELIALNNEQRRARGLEHTPGEIARQPDLWRETASLIAGRMDEIASWLHRAGLPGGDSRVILSGAGSSNFIGHAIAGLLTETLGACVQVIPTTSLVTQPEQYLPRKCKGLFVSFARSGNSPESLATVEIARQEYPELLHLVITCDPGGQLAQRVSSELDSFFTLVLPESANDQGLAMTASFTSMVIAGQALAFLNKPEVYLAHVEQLAKAGERILTDAPVITKAVTESKFSRACFLGAGTLLGCAAEAHLKLQELTNGQVVCLYDSFLGIRHGPQAAIQDDTLVIYMLSSDPYARLYELDLLREHHHRSLGGRRLVVMDRATPEVSALVDTIIEFDPNGELSIPDNMRPPVDVIVGQLLGLFASLSRGLRPDNPSIEGIISRVVEGVRIHPRP